MKNTILSILLLILVACASNGSRVRHVASNESPAKAIEKLQALCQKAKEQEIPTLSPTHSKNGFEYTEAARALFQKGATMEEIFSAIDKAEKELSLAFETGQLSRSQLKDSFERRSIAKEVLNLSEQKNVSDLESLKEDFADGEKAFQKLTKAVEDGETQWARDHQEKSVDYFNQVIARGSHKASLDEAERIIHQAAAEGAKKYVPKTYAETNKKLEVASRTIAKDPRNTPVVQKATEAAHFQARRLLELTRSAKEFSNREPEEIALWVETRLHSINTLVANDVRDRAFEEQVTNIQRSIAEMKRTGKTYQGEAKKLETSIKGLQSELKVKGKAYVIEEKVATLRKMFDVDEADVFREGRRVTIRLKSLRFPQGQAGLSSDSFPVLEKVQKGIALFGTPKLTVEGHTDSSGSDNFNQRLSLERARSVKGYLLSSGKISNSQVSIAGMGFTKPLTSDKTEQGRAMNRRIDVVMEVE